MKNWGIFSNIVGFIRHSQLPISIHTASPEIMILAACAFIGMVLYFSGIFLVVPNLVYTLWPWRTPYLVPEATNHYLLTRDISWLTAFKGLIFLIVIWTVFKGVKSRI